jgi:membrane protein DedA with SNARE-associated domain
VANALGAAGWVCTVGTAAYILGSSASSLFEAIGFAGLLAVVLAIVGHVVWRRSQRDRKAAAPREPVNDLGD